MGAGEAGVGIADLLTTALEIAGVPKDEARKRCWLFDSEGLVVKSKLKGMREHKIPYAHDHEFTKSFADAVNQLKPTAIIGVAAVAGTFTEEVIKNMCKVNERPIIFALSNPTSKSECTAEQAYRISGGKVVFASGSPFPSYKDESGKLFVPRQGNNAYIFPGVGLGVVAAKSDRVTDKMFYAAAKALADAVTDEDLKQGSVYPPLEKIRDISLDIGIAVTKVITISAVQC
eukprot:TRINITY_DN2142_c0_g2_i3.p1 TRINITY_DN2142_c0_g2~~TRINITY_DN2142_c0_g2_i3.p1  ORF type:complete len:231 (-),score=60.32 TRINITY_DN2142_c0_g2_i3:32-724(-)